MLPPSLYLTSETNVPVIHRLHSECFRRQIYKINSLKNNINAIVFKKGLIRCLKAQSRLVLPSRTGENKWWWETLDECACDSIVVNIKNETLIKVDWKPKRNSCAHLRSTTKKWHEYLITKKDKCGQSVNDQGEGGQSIWVAFLL